MIDWHNFGYTILALRLSPRHPLVRVRCAMSDAARNFLTVGPRGCCQFQFSRVYERWFSRRVC